MTLPRLSTNNRCPRERSGEIRAIIESKQLRSTSLCLGKISNLEAKAGYPLNRKLSVRRIPQRVHILLEHWRKMMDEEVGGLAGAQAIFAELEEEY